MFRRTMTHRWGRRSFLPYRRTGYLTYSHAAMVVIVSLAAIVILYLLGYIAL